MAHRTRFVAFAISLASAATLGAQAGPVAPSWGTTDTTLYTLGPCDARNREQSHPAIPENCRILLPVAGNNYGSVGIPVHLPTGALMTEVIVNYYDTATAEPIVELLEVSPTGLVSSLSLVNFPVFSGGDNTVTQPLNHEVANINSYSLLVRLNIESESAYNALYSVSLGYRLQVSPPPATPTFGDVPTGHPFFQFIEALAASGITGGCGSGNYCPDNPVTRGQMAVFIAKALGLHFPN